MDAEHERALVAWANTFGVGASSLTDFASGDLLVPIARAILAQDHFANDSETGFEANTTGWPIVISLLRSARILRDSEHVKQAKVDHGAEEGGILAVSCLEALLGYAVGEECADREAIICDIMSLDAPDQYILRRIIVDRQSSNRDTSFCEADAETSPVSSPVSSLRSCHPSVTRLDSDDFMSPNWTRKIDGSPQRKGTLGSEMLREGSEPRREGRNLAFEAEDVLGGTTAQQDAARSSSCDGNGQTAQTLREEIGSLQQQRDEANAARDSYAKALNDHQSESASRETELMEELQRARRMVEKAASSEEASFIAAEKALRTKHEEEVSRLLERASDAERRVSELETLEDEVARLRDEVDILQPCATNLSKAEENLARCRAKIEELSDLPQQLKREEDAHAEVLDRCLGLESEVSNIPALRRQLDGYRRAKTEMEVASREQARELKLAKEEVSRLMRETEALSDESEAVRHEHRRLQEELKRRAMEEEAGGGGIGEGVSELNPVLSEELARLRREKEQLTEKIDHNTVEMVQELEQRAGDADRLADSFHEQLAAERRRSAAAEDSLAEARKDIENLTSEMTELRAEHEAEVAKLGAEAELASRLAAEELDCAKREACETLAASERAAAEALDNERSRGAEALATAEREAAEVVEGLRAEKARAAEQAEAEAIAAAEDHARVVADLEATVAAVETAAAQEKARMEQEAGAQAELARCKEQEAAEKLAEVKLASEAELERTKEMAERELSDTQRAAASELASAQDETAREREARLEECRMKEEALARVRDLEQELEDGKRAAMEAYRRLKDKARESLESAALEHEKVQKELEARLAELQSELDGYRKTHTVADETYNGDMDRWEHQLTTQRALIANLHGEVDTLKKDKRRLEREKAYYWGQAEELRLSQAGGSGRGTTDPTLNEDHAQLLEQAQELIEENRHLKQRLQEGDGLARGDAVPRPAGWGRSGVAAMRAEHESEVTALKEEKLDMVMKYQASAARVREEEQRCAELTDSVEDLQMQVTKLQLVCKRQEKKLASAAAATCNVGSQPGSIETSTVMSINEASALHPTSGYVEPKMLKTSMGANKDKENTVRFSNCTSPGGGCYPVSDPSDRSRCVSVGPEDVRLRRAQGHTEGRTYSVTSPGSSSAACIPKCISRDDPLTMALGSGKPNAADPPLLGGRDKRQRALRDIENGPCVVDGVGVGRGISKGDGGEARRFRKEDEPIGALKAKAVPLSTGEEEMSDCRQS